MITTQKELKKFLSMIFGQRNMITVPRALVDITGSLSSAMLLSQLLYWTDKSTRDGWVYKSAKEWYEEIAIPEKSLRTAKKRLEELNLIETEVRRIKGTPVTHYRVLASGIENIINQQMESTKKTNGNAIFEESENVEPTAKETLDINGNLQTKGSFVTAEETLGQQPNSSRPTADGQFHITGDYTENTNNEITYNKYIVGERFLTLWNEQTDLTKARSTDSLFYQIKKTLSMISEEDLESAIINYNKVLSSPTYFFDFRWRFIEFLQRGNSTQGINGEKGYRKFIPSANPLQTFKNSSYSEHKDMRQQVEFKLLEFSPQKLLDLDKQRWMGVLLEQMEFLNPKETYWDTVAAIKQSRSDPDILKNAQLLRNLEEVIAKLLYDKNDDDLLTKLIDLHKRIVSYVPESRIQRYKDYNWGEWG